MIPCKILKPDEKIFFLFGWTLLLFLFLPFTSHSARAQEVEVDIKRLYESRRCDEIISSSTSTLKTPNASQALYLGLCYLREKNRQGTIKAWQNYLQLESESDQKREISKYLTLLIQDEAKINAQNRIAQEKRISAVVNPNAIAVYPFQNLGLPENEVYAKGMVEFIITDLSQVKSITVVERVQIQAILDELSLAKTPLFDKKSGPRLGKLVGAAKVTTGSYMDLDENKIQLDASIIQTEQGNIIASPTASGQSSTFFQLEKEIVFKILCGIGHCPESLDSETRQAVEKIHTRNLKAFRLYSEGLDFFDQREFRKASQNFFLAIEEDPEFTLARKGLLEMPLVPLDLEGLLSNAESASASGDRALPTIATVTVSPFQMNSLTFIQENIITEPVVTGTLPVLIDFVIHIP